MLHTVMRIIFTIIIAACLVIPMCIVIRSNFNAYQDILYGRPPA